MAVVEDLSNWSKSAWCYCRSMLSLIEGSEALVEIRLFYEEKQTDWEYFESHVWPERYSMRLYIHPIQSFTWVCIVPRSLELGCSIVWLHPASVMWPHCPRLREPPVLDWWACALQSNQHSWSVTELQIYIYMYIQKLRSQPISICVISCLMLMCLAIILCVCFPSPI